MICLFGIDQRTSLSYQSVLNSIVELIIYSWVSIIYAEPSEARPVSKTGDFATIPATSAPQSASDARPEQT